MIDLTKSLHDYDHDFSRYGEIDYVSVDSEMAAYRRKMHNRRVTKYVGNIAADIWSIARVGARDLDIAHALMHADTLREIQRTVIDPMPRVIAPRHY